MPKDHSKKGGIFWLSIGHVSLSNNHFFKHTGWYLWLHGVFI